MVCQRGQTGKVIYMSLTDNPDNRSKQKKSIIFVISAVIIIAAVILVIWARSGYLATTMRLLRTEGTVNIENSKGDDKPAVKNVRFQSGDAINTGSDGLASVGLDNYKIVTLQNDSRAEFRKKRKQLELKLTKGALFFNVTEKLRADEVFEIKTSTMTAGIRGTSGIIYYDAADSERESLVITDGSVEVSATNPETNETKTARVEAGQMIKVYLYPDRTEGSVEFHLDEITEEDLSVFALSRITEDEALMNRVLNNTKWNKENLKKGLSGQKPAKAPTDVPTPSPVPTETPVPTATPTPEPTSTPTPSPKPTAKPKATNTPRPTRKPTKKPTKKPSLSPKSGCSALAYAWGVKFDGKKIYICFDSRHNCYGYVSGKWVALDVDPRVVNDGSGNMLITFDRKDNGQSYFMCSRNQSQGIYVAK